MSCKHEHILFENGSLYLICVDCDQIWGALDRKGGCLQYVKEQDLRPFLPDTRHDRFVIPRFSKNIVK